MPGNSSVTGNQTIAYTDNMCFDGTARGAPMSQDGQLWIGSATSNRANDGGHVRLGSLTAGSGITITNGPGTISIASTASATDLHVAKLIVNSTSSAGGNFTTITAALAAAVSGDTIFVMPGATGVYTENLTLKAGVDICAFDGDQDTPNVTIVGNLTATFAGRCSVSGIRLQTNSASLLTVSGNSATVVNINACYLNCSNNTGITLSSSSASSVVIVYNCKMDTGTTGIGVFAHSGAGQLTFQNCFQNNSGATVTASTVSGSGNLQILNSYFSSPITTSSTSNCLINGGQLAATNTTALTIGGSGNNNATSCSFSTGSATSISVSVGCSLTLTNCVINSSNVAAIAGAGSISYGGLVFSSSSSAITTTTQTLLNQGPHAAFMAFQNTTTANATGDGTVYVLGTTLDLIEVYDENSVFNPTSGVFTAPVTGIYQFFYGVEVSNLGAGHNQFQIALTTTGKTFLQNTCNPIVEALGGAFNVTGNASINMSAGDTATLGIYVAGSTKTVTIFGAASPNVYTFFSGYKVS